MRFFRKLLPTEGRLFRDHLLRLSAADRASRFAGATSDGVIVTYARRFDWLTGILIGCFIDGTLRGVAELRGLAPAVGWRAELAITVEEDWQNHHIGTGLLQRAAGHARNRGLKSLCMLCLSENHRMQAIARKLSGDLVFEDGQVEVDISLPFATHLTLWAESVGDSLALAGSWWDQLAHAEACKPASGRT